MNIIKCPKCNGEMEEGVFTEGWWYSGSYPLRKNKSSLGKYLGLSSLNELSSWEVFYQMFQRSKTVKGKEVIPLKEVKSYRCTVCGYLESYSK